MKTAKDIKIGDVIYPPERELRLWMRRELATRNLPESALHFRVESISESKDARGPWLVIKTRYPESWGPSCHPLTFKARPETPWKFAPDSELADRLAGCAQSFRDSLDELSMRGGLPVLEIFALWRKYSDSCANSDQSALLWEFEQWYAIELGLKKGVQPDPRAAALVSAAAEATEHFSDDDLEAFAGRNK